MWYDETGSGQGFRLYAVNDAGYQKGTGGWDGLMQALGHSEELLQKTWELDGDAWS